jgi:hypothetical protein
MKDVTENDAAAFPKYLIFQIVKDKFPDAFFTAFL